MSFFNFHSLVSTATGSTLAAYWHEHLTPHQGTKTETIWLYYHCQLAHSEKFRLEGQIFYFQFFLYQPNAPNQMHIQSVQFQRSKVSGVFLQGSQHFLQVTPPPPFFFFNFQCPVAVYTVLCSTNTICCPWRDGYMLPPRHMMALSFDMLLSVQAPWLTYRTGTPIALPSTDDSIFFSSGVAAISVHNFNVR